MMLLSTASTGIGLTRSFSIASRQGVRSFTTAHGNARSSKAWQTSTALFKIVAPASFALAAVGYSTSSKPLHAESKTNQSQSGWKLREVDRSAPRISSTHLVFMSHEEDHREAWQGWIGYFRVAGYNCVDLNFKMQDEANTDELSKEIGDQVRLLSLQRPPVLFAYSGQGARTALHHIQSSKPKIGGLILVLPEGSDLDGVEQAEKLDKNKLNILVLDNKEDRQAIRTAERWLDSQGFS